MNGDLISRQAALDGIEELKKSPWATDKRGNGFEYLITEALEVVAELCVKQASSVNPQKIGHWIKRSSIGVYECSVCKTTTCIDDIGHYNFCPNCGSDMRDKENEE